MQGLLSISLHFCNDFINKFNSTRAPLTVRFNLSYGIKITSKSGTMDAKLIHGFLSDKTWLLIVCDTTSYAIQRDYKIILASYDI